MDKIIPIAILVLFIILTASWLFSRYRMCPPDKILIVFGKVGTGQPAKCYHGGSTFGYSTKTLNATFVKALNDRHDALREKGVTVYMSFAPHNYNALAKPVHDPAYKEAYTQFYRDNFTSPVISYLGGYTLKGEFMYDSDWHPNDEGRRMRSEQLGKDLRAQMVKDGFLK